MKPIEQVLFRIRQTATKREPMLLAATPQVGKPDLHEIADWFSESPEDTAIRFDLSPLFFQALPLGNYLIGQITPEESLDESDVLSLLKPPESFFVHGLVVPAETLLCAGNHPIALYERLRHENLVTPIGQPSAHLEPLPAVFPNELIQPKRLESVFERTNPVTFISVFQSLFDSICTVFQPPAGLSPMSFLSAMFDFLPILERTELTFSTGFFFSQQNPLRIVAAGNEGDTSQAVLARFLGLPFFSFDDRIQRPPTPERILLADPWPRLVYRVIKTKN